MEDYVNHLVTLPNDPPLQTPKTSFKGSFKGSSKTSSRIVKDFKLDDIISSLTKTMLGFWKQHTDITGYEIEDLIKTSADGNMTKLWIPLPWWNNESGAFNVMEIAFCKTKYLDQTTKHKYLNALKDIRFMDMQRISSWNTFIFYVEKEKIKASFKKGSYTYLIRNDTVALHHVLRFIMNGLESVELSVKKAKWRKMRADEMLGLLRDFIDQMEALNKEEIHKLNNAKD